MSMTAQECESTIFQSLGNKEVRIVANTSRKYIQDIKNSIDLLNELNQKTTFELFSQCVPKEMLKSIMFVVLSGCGANFQTAQAARVLFEDTKKGTPCGSVATVQRPLYVSRFRNRDKGWHPVLTKRTLFTAFSTSGESEEIITATEKLNDNGGNTIAFTQNSTSRLAGTAQYTVPIARDSREDHTVISDYISSTFTAMMFGLYFSMIKGRITEADAKNQRDSLMRYINSFAGRTMSNMEKITKKIAEDWKESGVEYVDVVADGSEFATARFVTDLMVKNTGLIAMVDDTEDWNHIPFWTKAPERVGTILFANSTSPSFSRAVENAEVYEAFERKLVVVTDAEDTSCFPESATVIKLPKSEYRWGYQLMEHLAIDYLTAYLCEK